MAVSSNAYVCATKELDQIGRFIDSLHPTARRHLEQAAALIIGVRTDLMPEVDDQEIRNHLLLVREIMGDDYEKLPVPDKLLRHCDAALEAIPGRGEPSKVPYE